MYVCVCALVKALCISSISYSRKKKAQKTSGPFKKVRGSNDCQSWHNLLSTIGKNWSKLRRPQEFPYVILKVYAFESILHIHQIWPIRWIGNVESLGLSGVSLRVLHLWAVSTSRAEQSVRTSSQMIDLNINTADWEGSVGVTFSYFLLVDSWLQWNNWQSDVPPKYICSSNILVDATTLFEHPLG